MLFANGYTRQGYVLVQKGKLTPRAFAAALRTIGVSSPQRLVNILLISSCTGVDALEYGDANSAHADVRDVNQSPCARRRRRGRKFCSICCALSRKEILLMLSDAYPH